MNELWIIRMLGIFFVMLGIVIRMGYLRKLYFASRGGIYGYIPMGLVFILYTFYEEVKTTRPELIYYYYAAFGILIAAAVYLSVAKPRFIKPAWTIWLDKYPEKVIKSMTEDIKNNPDWEKNTVNEEAVERWAKSLKRK
ncbi:MAG: hypothetical protein HPY72_00400 [Anaerolineae bacterium]|jgi:hypothetical protein|nr:hypothetical protein [Anaerolineae bacterium]